MRRLTILLAAVGALMLLPAAQAFGAVNTTINITGSGSGEVISIGSGEFFTEEANPPVACKYNGTSTSGTCETEAKESFEESGYYNIYLEAVAAPGSSLVGWSVQKGEENETLCPLESNTSQCITGSLEEGEELEVTATFAKSGPPLTLNVEEGSGTVVSNPAGLECSKVAGGSCTTEAIEEGKKVVLTASPDVGFLFKSWKGCDTGGVNGRQCTVTLSGAKTVGVKFIKAFPLTGTKSEGGGLGIFGTSPGGINCGYSCKSSTALYKEGSVTVKAKPAKNFHFVEFKGGTGSAASCNGVTAETCTFTLSSGSGITEVYAENAKSSLSLTKKGGGQGFVKTKPTNINCGLTCTSASAGFFATEEPEVTVTLGKGTSSVTWVEGAGTCTGNALTCKVPMSSSHELVAKFE